MKNENRKLKIVYLSHKITLFHIKTRACLHMSKKYCIFAAEMRKYVFFIICALVMAGCNKPSKMDQYHAEKHVRDSIALGEQERSMVFYQSQLDSLMPVVDSLLPLFNYEKNEKYQDQGYYVVKPSAFSYRYSDLRVMVRDDGRDVLVYKEGKRFTDERVNELRLKGNEALDRADHLAVVMRDVKELEKRIQRTSLEIQKYEKRLTNEGVNE